MERKELYESAYGKLQRLYCAIFDENGDLKPEFYLKDEEIEAFRSYSGNLDDESREQFETLFGGIIYNKYSFKCSSAIKNIYEMSCQIMSIWKTNKYLAWRDPIYTRSASGWDGNMMLSIVRDEEIVTPKVSDFIKIGLYNLGGTYEYDINIDVRKTADGPEFDGEIKIVREKKKVTGLNGSSYYEDYGVESYGISQIYSKECETVLLAAENELSVLLNDLTMGETSSDEKRSGTIRR